MYVIYCVKSKRGKSMVGIVIVSENRQACEMLKTARRLVGPVRGIKTVVLKPGTPPARMRKAVAHAIESINSCRGVILLADIYGSTQCNVCANFVKNGVVELVTGFNLPMIVKLCTIRDKTPLKKLTTFIEKYGREHIQHYNGNRKK